MSSTTPVPMADPVIVIGMGAIGTTIAAKIAQTGRPIIACACSRIDEVILTDDAGTVRHSVQWIESPEQLPPAHWVLLATKIHHIPEVAPWLRRAGDANSRVLVLQNGVEHQQRVSRHTIACVVPSLVYTNAERIAPGVVTRRTNSRDLVLPNDDPGREVAHELLADSGLRVELTDDFLTDSWVKLLTNLAANPISALTGRRVEVIREPLIATLAERVLAEAVAVGQAAGAQLTPAHAGETLAWLQALPEGSTTSMLQDRLAGRSLEVDGLTGVVVRLGEQYGIPTPANAGLLALLSAIQPGS